MSENPTVELVAAERSNTIRRLVMGAGCFVLPWLLVLGSWLLDGQPWRPSISAYYHSSMGTIFVIAVTALGIMLFSYPTTPAGASLSLTSRLVRPAPMIAAIACVVVAFVPTAPEDGDKRSTESLIHLGASAIMLVSMIGIALLLFDDRIDREEVSAWEKVAYRTAAAFMILALLGSLLLLFKQDRGNDLFWWEIVALYAFAGGWLVKNVSLLQSDQGPRRVARQAVLALLASGSGRRPAK